MRSSLGYRGLIFELRASTPDNPNTGNDGSISHGYYYRGDRYLNGFTNNGFLLGNWVGRQGQGVQAWTNYWFGPRDRIQLNFRHQTVSQQFLPGGGTLSDAGAKADFWLTSNVMLSGAVQYEKWNYPVINPMPQSNVTTSMELSFWPGRWNALGRR